MRLYALNVLMLLTFLLGLPVSARAQVAADYGSLTIAVRPPNAEIFVDGERWVSPDATTALTIQLPPGRHTVQVRAQGFRSYNSTVEIHAGQATPLNVILPSGPGVNAFGEPQGPPMAAPPPAAPGPISQVSRKASGDGFVFAPDFKITEMNHRTTGFAGFYGGAVFANTFMIGGGAYFQLDDHNSEQMVYGGLVSEYRLFGDHPVGLTLHGLAGWGTANVGYYYGGCGSCAQVDPRHGGYYSPYYYGYGAYEGFFVGVPEAQVVARFGHDVRLVGGLGYRWTSSDFHDLNGVSGTIAVQIGK
jgi:hypothetical protein